MSSTAKEGAAAAAPSTPEEAERQLAEATTPEEAWRIYELSLDREEGWRAVKLKAERRYGELLGLAEHGGDRKSDQVTSSHLNANERKTRQRARKVAAVPKEKFEEYLNSTDKPSREGLLREHGPKRPPKAVNPNSTRARSRMNNSIARQPWKDDRVIDWATKRVAAGATVDELVQQSAGGEHDWPLDGKSLGQNAAEKCKAIVEDRLEHKRETASPKKKKGPTEGGKRKRKLYELIREDGDSKLRRLQIEIASAVQSLEHYVLPDDIGLSEEAQDDIASLYEDLTMLGRWQEHAITATIGCMTDLSRRRTIRKLRDRIEDRSVGEHERDNARRAIQRLEASYRAKRLKA